jgi:hypothetical protein
MTFYDMIRIWDILVNYIFQNESCNLSKNMVKTIIGYYSAWLSYCDWKIKEKLA